MAHLAKYKAPAVGALVAHYDRRIEIKRGYRRPNIDHELTIMNENLRPRDVPRVVAAAIARHEEITGRRLRKDANVMADWVVTMPRDCPYERADEFFAAVAQFIEQRYGENNVLGAWVHMDEAQPHVHMAVMPIIEGRFNAKGMFTRAEMRAFHGELNAAVDTALGMHVSLLLNETEQGDKQLSHLNQREYKAAKRRLAEVQCDTRRAERRLESLQQKADGVEREVDGLRDRLRAAESRFKALTERVRTEIAERWLAPLTRCLVRLGRHGPDAERAYDYYAQTTAQQEDEMRRQYELDVVVPMHQSARCDTPAYDIDYDRGDER